MIRKTRSQTIILGILLMLLGYVMLLLVPYPLDYSFSSLDVRCEFLSYVLVSSSSASVVRNYMFLGNWALRFNVFRNLLFKHSIVWSYCDLKVLMLMWTFNTALIYKLYVWIIVDWVGVQDDKYEELLYCSLAWLIILIVILRRRQITHYSHRFSVAVLYRLAL